MTTEQITALKLEIAKAEKAVEQANYTADKMSQGDSWHDGHRLLFGRLAKAAFTRLRKREEKLARLNRRLAELTKGVA